MTRPPASSGAADAADFYTGLVADLYAPLRSHAPDVKACEKFIRDHGEPALELGCGDGDPLLELRRRGLDVEGLDSSPDMIARCRARADAAGLLVVLHVQRMEDLDLPRRFRSIVLAGPTFVLLPDDGRSLRALQRISAHLEPDGAALVPLWVPRLAPAAEVGASREVEGPDGVTLRFTYVSQGRDDVARVQRAVLRYERLGAGRPEVVERTWTLHWHTPSDFRRLAAQAGLTTLLLDSARQPLTEDADAPDEFTAVLRHA